MFSKNDNQQKQKKQYLSADSQARERLERTRVEIRNDAAPLPCLFRNNSTEFPSTKDSDPREAIELAHSLASFLTPYHKKVAHTLFSNVKKLVSESPSINNVGFMTLTFPDNVSDPKEAQKRFNSFNTHFLKKSSEFSHWLAVKERQKRGAWHYHILVICKDDIRTGVNFSAFKKCNYRSAPEALRNYWALLRTTCSKYGFGRSELLPIQSNEEGIARYIGKYISKHIDSRLSTDKGVRLVNSSSGWSKNSLKFSWYNDNSVEWRRKLSLFAQLYGCDEIYKLTEFLGLGWAFRYQEVIKNIDEIIIKEEPEPCVYKPNLFKTIQRNKDYFEKLLTITKHHKKRVEISQDKINLETHLETYTLPPVSHLSVEDLPHFIGPRLQRLSGLEKTLLAEYQERIKFHSDNPCRKIPLNKDVPQFPTFHIF